MNMGMGMHFELRQVMICVICDKDVEEHADTCPQGRLQALCGKRVLVWCPACCKQAIEENRAGYYECRNCHEVLSTGLVCGGYDPDTLQRKHIKVNGEVVPVLVLPERGTGDFPIDDVIKMLRKEIAQAKRAARRRRKEAGRG